MSDTITDTLLLVRPSNFGYNKETAENNSFQVKEGAEHVIDIKTAAINEFDSMVVTLKSYDIEVIVIQDTDQPAKPDAVFPNNWFTTHASGPIITYPMNAESRRPERREDIIDTLTERFGYNKRYGFEYLEEDQQFLEATGSMILDRDNKIVYASLSPRTDIRVLEKFAVLLNYQKVIFHAYDASDVLIYHTNVMMALGTSFVIICLDSIKDESEKKNLLQMFDKTNKQVIPISVDQMDQFAGNMLQVKSKLGEKYLLMSTSAYTSLNEDQVDEISKYSKILHMPIPTIEKYGGGSVRCMIAEVYPVI